MPKQPKLQPPCGYMGGKRRVADEVAGAALSLGPTRLYDLCAGSGALSLGAIERGLSAEQVTLVEAGPWGEFWCGVANKTLDLDYIRRMLLTELPPDPKLVARWLSEDVALRDPTPETFLVLQSGSFGSVPVWWDGSRWRQANPEHNRGYNPRQYWEPGPKSKETKPRGTIFGPSKIVKRVEAILSRCDGISAIHGRVEDVDYDSAPLGSVFCMDPPYKDDSGYGFTLNVDQFVSSGPRPLLVLEGYELPGANYSRTVGLRRGHNVNKNTARKPDVLSTFL